MDVTVLLMAVVLVENTHVQGAPLVDLWKCHAPGVTGRVSGRETKQKPTTHEPMADRRETNYTPIRRDVRRRDDGVVVVREDDPETGERVERKYPSCPVVTAVKRRRDGR